MSGQDQSIADYRCPGEGYAIPRAVHLGRLARFYPACRQCPHRGDIGTLSTRQTRQLAEIQPHGLVRSLFGDEGVATVDPNELTPAIARCMAAAFGVCLRAPHPTPHIPLSAPTVLLAGDGQPLTAPLVAAIREGLRWSGCGVGDIGPASAACLAFAMNHLEADGGVSIASERGVAIKFWGPGAQPLSRGGLLDRIEEIFHAGCDRPTRRYGPLQPSGADVSYLAHLTPYYHGLRPLRWVLDSACQPVRAYLRRLTASSACRVIALRGPRDRLGEQVVAEQAHFGLHINGDGETCRLLDEQGRPVPNEKLLLLVARNLLGATADPVVARGVVVLEEDAPKVLAQKIQTLGGRVVASGTRRAEMDRAMREHAAVLGGGASGRFWYSSSGLPLADALTTLTLLLVLLSRSDRPLSQVLDDEASLD